MAAERELLKSVELDPRFAPGYFNLGQLKFDLNDPPAGKYYFQKASELGSRDARLYYNMGVILRKNREFDAALLNFEKALALRPEWVEARLMVANGLAYLGRCPEAIKLIKEAPAPHPSFNQLISRCQNR